MYRDFVDAARHGRPPQMSLERALEDQRLMDQIYASVTVPEPAGEEPPPGPSDLRRVGAAR
jgi:predicted dehydrogenase